MKGIITRNPKERALYFNLYIEIYKSAHYTIFVSASDYSDPHFHIQETETCETPLITGVHWDDLKDVMETLELLEEEAQRELIGE